MAPGIAGDICREPIIFVTPIALKLLQLGPNSKQGKQSGDHCRFFQCIYNSIAQSLLFLTLVDRIKVVFPIEIIVKTLCFIITASFRLKMARNAGNCIIFAGKSVIRWVVKQRSTSESALRCHYGPNT